MMITDPEMFKKMQRALKQGQGLYDLNDIASALATGHMQSHTVGDTVAFTQIHDWPQRKAVHVLLTVGHLSEAIELEGKLDEFARGVGASLLTAVGRDGWWKHRVPGWKKVGTLYAKDIT